MTLFKPPGVHRYVADQTVMKRAIEGAKQANAERNGYAHGLSNTTYALAKQLEEIAEGGYCEASLGVSFRAWVATLSDEHGKQRTFSWAKGLRRQLRKIRFHPLLVAILEQQEPLDAAGFINFSSAFFTAKLAEEENWSQKVASALRSEEVKAEDWETEKKNRLRLLYYKWGTQSTRAIQDRIAEIRGDRADADIPAAWPHHGGRVDPNVKERYDTALERLAAATQAGDVGGMTYTREIECLAEGVNDLLDALDSAAEGETKQLRSWLEQISGETNVRLQDPPVQDEGRR